VVGVALEAWDNMKMDMRDNLASCGTIGLVNVYSVGFECSSQPVGNFLDNPHEMGKQIVWQSREWIVVRLWDHKRVPLYEGANIQKCKHLIVLIDLCAGQLARNYFAEDAVVMIHRFASFSTICKFSKHQKRKYTPEHLFSARYAVISIPD
jgi:hypothetical protein